MRLCTLASPGTISGRVFSDVDGNDVYGENADGFLSDIDVQLFDTQGTNSTADDIFISVTSSGADGIYEFVNLPANPNYELRVITNDTDLPSGATLGTAASLASPLLNGANVTGHDFGFDLSNAKLEASKIVSPFDPAGYSLPGEDVVYTIEVFNRGGGEADQNSLFLVDKLPPQVIFRNLEFDNTTVDPVKFQQDSAALNFDYERDVGFSLNGPPPANFAACNYTPSAGYDENVAYICFAPNGRMQGGDPSPSFSVGFRTRIK